MPVKFNKETNDWEPSERLMRLREEEALLKRNNAALKAFCWTAFAGFLASCLAAFLLAVVPVTIIQNGKTPITRGLDGQFAELRYATYVARDEIIRRQEQVIARLAAGAPPAAPAPLTPEQQSAKIKAEVLNDIKPIFAAASWEHPFEALGRVTFVAWAHVFLGAFAIVAAFRWGGLRECWLASVILFLTGPSLQLLNGYWSASPTDWMIEVSFSFAASCALIFFGLYFGKAGVPVLFAAESEKSGAQSQNPPTAQ